ncbi:putative YT521-B-like splicing factor [Aspergillus clavatus NRRL 1]|uniref:YT521-B-like splicing factor, putative n=1 Tax=Aspergillus clavatus (strain ATCC 1007 / CBS 513.65 / DSM 816 / NCTC 3887 / NRRL 1 / QM 1276 / 107) TaxID=344612 RepID=A1CD65_ASPCL|nr:YT521-B-like splicing factor, putative [Aspergillus clavatus NRRL 1]EAW11792.1 YT521-B-like splicing factor, putative [Aspergillus clavatus NRRL 1]
MYTPFAPQQQHQNTSLQHGIANYQLYASNMNAPLNVSVPNQTMAYGQGYYTPHLYTAPVGHGPGPSNASLYPPPGGQYHNTQDFIAQAPAMLPRESRQQAPRGDYDVSRTIVDGSTPMRPTPTQSISTDSSQPSSTSGSSSPWGPPRKPKQSGHALWVGNLPAGTNVVDLKDYFSRDATKDIQSVFLISKSNCAFVNYKTEATCIAALARFHDSRFNGVRLVCRLRRGLTSPGKAVGIQSTIVSSVGEQGDMKGYDRADETVEDSEAQIAQGRATASNLLSRYFVVKSLTVGDLELSRQSGIWATQSHNEVNLNRAFESAPNVYLIFSANKSGEYYGYARMMSPIQEDQGLASEMPLRLEPTLAEPEELTVIPTQATVTAPAGRIIDDSARGTIFWEADSSEDDDDGDRDGDGRQEDVENRGEEGGGGDENDCGADAFRPGKSVIDLGEESAESGFNSIGRPFRVQWLSAERVPFHRTRGLRNPWNANREVKIARDGTEIEPSVGERLIQLFHTRPPGHGLPIYHTPLPN